MKFAFKAAAVAALAVGVYVYDKSKNKVRTLSKKEVDKIVQGDTIEPEYVVLKDKEEPKAKAE